MGRGNEQASGIESPGQAEISPEKTPILEGRFQLSSDVKVLIISGPSGSGKTSNTEKLSKILGVEIFHAGEKFRMLKEETDQIGYFDRPIEADEEIDAEQRNIIEDENSEIKIIESRLGIVNVDEITHAPIGKIVRILITADDSVRLNRVIIREGKKLKEIGLELSDAEIIEQTRDREERDRIQWSHVHPILRNYSDEDSLAWTPINPYDRTTTIRDGEHFYDLVLDTTNLTKDEALEELVRMLLRNGHIFPSEDVDNYKDNFDTIN